MESDLEQANRKVEKAVKQSADDTVKIEEKKTSSIRSESGKVVESAKSAADTVTSSWKKSGEDSASFFGNLKDTLTDTFTSAADSSIPLVGEVGNLTKGHIRGAGCAIGAGQQLSVLEFWRLERQTILMLREPTAGEHGMNVRADRKI